MTAPARLVREGFPELLSQNRAPGRHLSDVTRSLCIGLGDFDDDREAPKNLMNLGLTMEWGLCQQLMLQYPGRYARFWDAQNECWKSGIEVERDGISGNLDLLNVEERPYWAVEDVKMTRKSRRHDQDSPKWREAWMRLKGYAWMTGARVGRLWIAYLFDYSERFGGDVVEQVWERRWDTPQGEEELKTNWTIIVRHERQMAPINGGE